MNNKFPGSHFHHLIFDMEGNLDYDIGIYIPEYLHNSVFHNGETGQGLRQMNILAWDFLRKQRLKESQ